MPAEIRRFLYVVLTLIAVGAGLWLIDTYIPMAASIRAILNIVVFLAMCVFVLKAFGLWSEVLGAWNRLTHRRVLP